MMTQKLAKISSTVSDVNLDIAMLAHASIKTPIRSNPNATTTAVNYTYDNGIDIGAPLNLYHNIVKGKGTIENTIGLTGSYVNNDSATGLNSILAPFSARTIIRVPAAMYVTPEHLRTLASVLFALQFPSVTSGVPDLAIWTRMVEGNAAWG